VTNILLRAKFTNNSNKLVQFGLQWGHTCAADYVSNTEL